jgi:hypothetical protein
MGKLTGYCEGQVGGFGGQVALVLNDGCTGEWWVTYDSEERFVFELLLAWKQWPALL